MTVLLNENEYLWPEYYDAFPYYTAGNVRKGCHPRKLLHNSEVGKAIVLIHGLSDSPYFMSAIAEYFHNNLGYNVYIPLLQSHGLKHPEEMAGVSLAEWKKNVHFAIECASKNAALVSIGGLSMGGALGFFFGCTDPAVSGDIYLFSGALGLSAGYFGFPGWLKGSFLRSPFIRFFEPKKPLVSSNPYRYERVSLNSARELAYLIPEINNLLQEFKNERVIAKRVFSAWSEFDKVVCLKALRGLNQIIPEADYASFIIPLAARVDHACVVLKDPVHAIGAEPNEAPLEAASPLFSEMMAGISQFESAGPDS